MADLRFLHFALMPSPARNEKQFSLPDDFSELDFTISLTDEPFRVWFSRAFSCFYNTFGDPQTVLHDENEARIFNISALRDTNRRLLAAVMQKERSVIELKAP